MLEEFHRIPGEGRVGEGRGARDEEVSGSKLEMFQVKNIELGTWNRINGKRLTASCCFKWIGNIYVNNEDLTPF
jgi:hypothetical protein